MVEITIPARSGAASGNRAPRGARLPDTGAVPTVSPAVARDPGVSVSPEAFGASQGRALQGAGQDIGQISEPLAKAAQRIRTREEAVERARAEGGFVESVDAELRRIETEGDWSAQDTLDGFGEFLDQQQQRLIGEHGGSQESRLALQSRLLSLRTIYSNQAATLSVTAQRELVAETLSGQLNPLVRQALQDPGSLNDLFAAWDERVDGMAPALTPDEEIVHRDTGREQLAVSALESLLNRGGFEEAKEVLAGTPGLSRSLSPGAQRQIESRIATLEQAETEARTAGLRKREELRSFLGRDPSPAELTRYIGVAPPQGATTPSQKIAAIEVALGRKLSAAEREQAVGLGPADTGFESEIGKLVADQERAEKMFGAGSAQAEAIREVVASKAQGEQPKVSDVSGLRKEFTKLSQPYLEARTGFEKVQTAADTNSAAGDVALIFGFMKTIDPGSTVREGEFATAEEAGGVPDRIVTLYNRLVTGERLSPEQRADFAEQAELQFSIYERAQLRHEEQYRNIAISQGMEPDRVVVNFRGAGQPGDVTGAQQGGAGEPIVLDYDLQGRPLGGSALQAAPTGQPAPAVSAPGEDGGAVEPRESRQRRQRESDPERADPRIEAAQAMMEFVSSGELRQLVDKDQGAIGHLARMELDTRTPEEAQLFIDNLDETMVNAEASGGLLRRVQESLSMLGRDVKINGRYSVALLKAFKEAKQSGRADAAP